MRTITCLFFAIVTLLLGNIRTGVGEPSDLFPALAAFVFLIAAVVFAFLDWPGLPTHGVEVPVEDPT
jgi:hypothetical protein